MKKIFHFSRSCSVHTDGVGNFFLVTNTFNGPVTIYQIDMNNKVSIPEGTTEEEFWPSVTVRETSNTGSPSKSFLIRGFSPKEEPRIFRYKIYPCNNIGHSTFLNIDSSVHIDRYSRIDHDRLIIYSYHPKDINARNIYLHTLTDKQEKPVLLRTVREPLWGFIADEQNNLYYATENGITKIGGTTGKTIWHTPMDLQTTNGISSFSINYIGSKIIITFIDKGLSISLRTMEFAPETGERVEFEPCTINHHSWYYPPNFVPAQERYNCLWRIVNQGRGSIILRLDTNKKAWELIGQSSVMFLHKFFICEENKFIVEGGMEQVKVELIQSDKQELLCNFRRFDGCDCVLSAKNQLGIYMEHKGKVKFIKMDI